MNRAPRGARLPVGHFVDDDGFDGWARYLAAYRDGMSELPPFGALFDVPTSFGTVRVYRFDGADPSGPPVVLLPGRNASTPMWRANLPGLLTCRTVYCVDLLGEAGLSVQDKPIGGPDDQAHWLELTLAGLNLGRVHLMGASIGGWAAVNVAALRPGRAASLTLLDPVMTFGRIPVKTLLASGAMVSPAVPEAWRRRFLSWLTGGAAVDDSLPEARLVAAAMVGFVFRLPVPKLFTDNQLRGLDIPVLAFIAGRSVMLRPGPAVGRARKLLRHGQVELWADATHAINGEYPGRVAERAHRFWNAV
ncbi:MAG: alpha/beta fold hydrolase [Mycobacterium sp.]